MTCYIYRKIDKSLLETVEASAITADGLVLESGEHLCLLGDFEVSQSADLSQCLLAEERAKAPSLQQRIDDLEELLMTLLYGGANE